MTAKQYLQQLRKIDVRIQQMMSEKEFLEAQLTNTTMAPREIQVIASLPQDPMADRVIQLVNLEKELNSRIDKLIDLRAEIVNLIQQLDSPIQMQVIYKRYVEFKKWDDIEKETNYSFQHLKRIHIRALRSLDQKMSQNEP